MDEQAPEGEQSETLKREDNAKLTPIEAMKYHVDLLTKVRARPHMETLRTVLQLFVKKYKLRPAQGTRWLKRLLLRMS